MNEMANRIWKGQDGQLVFDITISRNPSDGVPSVAKIYYEQDPQDEHLITINEARPTQFEIKFRSGRRVRGFLAQRAHVHIDGVDNTGIFADIHFGAAEIYHFEGLMVACPSRGSVAPWPPNPPDPSDQPNPPGPPNPAAEDPTESGSPLPIISTNSDDLFNYVYVRRWPRVSDEDLRYGFIQYRASSPPSSSFYDDLVIARQQGRYMAESLAVRFIDGDPPYVGMFVSSLRSLSGPVRDFASLAERIQQQAQLSPLVCATELASLLERYGAPPRYFTSAQYQLDIDRIWQSYFALVVTLGYDWALLNDLAQSIWLAHVIDLAVTLDPENAWVPSELTPDQIVELADAKVLLPASIFPLPPATSQHSSPPRGSDTGWIEPYAIGDLQMVRQRLVRYAPGEIARIENVMRGERKEISRRHVQRRVEVQEHRGSEEQLLQSDDADERSSLFEETRKMIAEKAVANNYADFQTSYGPPTLTTLNGSWTRTTTQGPNPGQDDVTRFAREILKQTVSRIRRKIGTLRTTSTMNQVEDLVTSVIDNTSGQTSMRAVFRWLNKVYEAEVINYGNRLMMEFLVRRPAARYIAQETALTGQKLARPLPPADLGVASFKDITPDNYAQLGARYGVTELEPPPLVRKYVTATLRGGEEQQIAVPSGYCAVNAFVSCVSIPAGLPEPIVLVGRQTFNSSNSSAPLRPYGEDSTLPVSVMGVELSSSPPTAVQVLVNVEVECEPSVRAMDEWRIGIYRAMMTSFQQLDAQYYSDFGPGGPRQQATRSPLANRQTEQRELENACKRLLLEHMARATGGQDANAWGSPPSPGIVDEPRYVQFLDESLEWTEMAYSFHVSPHAGAREDVAVSATPDGEEDPLFTSFLQADQARILLPVQPARVMAFLYGFSSGMLWDGIDRLVPVLEDDLALVNDLEHAARNPKPEREVGPTWELVVPTAMQVLDESLVVTPGAGSLGAT
ncbi:hypothetical protein ENSA5_62090 [Enhygromyxa salina]|uniref:Uncharacterized protein n=1 Tax=Enhygromyxa salina TaxID=215803 RepID=A0A2S9XD43_9BACT|nr:hypothetical protein [Enhygromyxa salina]PRP90775.1 hypothetical protein ENSA5_62090 [Enhygromyxa salina]